MCGLYASVGFAPEPARLDRAAHRGPDGRGWQVFDSPAGPVALGHRRLAIIDTSDAGLQPLGDPSGRYHILLNGEIYNYRELRRELEQRGCVFRTATDTEVLLQAYVTWGEAALDRLLGMFAFIIWDDGAKRLFAARDRLGIKPLYVTSSSHGLALASEIKQLTGLPSVSGRANTARLKDFLSTGISDHTEETMFEGIAQLRGGECLSLICDGRSCEPQVRRWYRPPLPSRQKMRAADAAEAFRALFMDSMQLHLRADVRVGSCLSGGLDSSSIVGAVSALLGDETERQHFATVSAVYPGTAVDEGDYARLVSHMTGFAAHRITPDARDLADHLESIIAVQDEPFGSTSILSQWAVFGAARAQGLKVMLDGQGADEQLAGYAGLMGLRLADLLRQGRLVMLGQTLLDRLPREGLGLRGQLSHGAQDMRALVRQMLPAGLRGSARRAAQKAVEGDWLRDRRGSVDALAAARLGHGPPRDLAEMSWLLTHATNLPMLLHWEDRSSMAHSIEARVPFLDHRLVEFSLSLHGDALFDKALTKRLLRDALKDMLPARVHARRDKLGFATPEGEWVRGALRPQVEAGVEEAIGRFPDVFDAAATRRLAAAKFSATGPLDFTLWRIANTGLWARAYAVAA
jgi:asparagine synthase (glutamine-hydrolysing)